MSVFEQLNTIKKNIAQVQDPALLFAMNKKVRELESQIETIKQLKVIL
jgi:hypothetical protein